MTIKDSTRTKALRGFAVMDPQKRRAIASLGGKAVPASKRSFSQDRELATEAGRKGGKAQPAASKSFSRDLQRAKEAGKKGGQVTAAMRKDRT